MNPFIKCPRCGLLDQRRTRCSCGYEVPPTLPVADTAQPEAPAAARKRNPGFTMRFIVAGLAVCAVAFYFGLKAGRDSGHSVAVEEVGKVFERMERARALELDRTSLALIEQLRKVKEEGAAQKALFECFLKGGEAARVGMLESIPESLPADVKSDLQKRAKLSETSETLIAEMKRVAAQFPRAHQAATTQLLDVSMPNRIRPPVTPEPILRSKTRP